MKFLILPLLFIFSYAHGACLEVWKNDLDLNLKKLSPALQTDLSDNSQVVNIGSSVGDLLQHNEILPKVRFEKKFIRILSKEASREEMAFLYADYNVDSGLLDLNVFRSKLEIHLGDQENFCVLDEELSEVRPLSRKEIFQLLSSPK